MVFQIWNEAQKRTLTFVPGSIVKVRRPVSRVEMNAKEILCALFPKNGQNINLTTPQLSYMAIAPVDARTAERLAEHPCGLRNHSRTEGHLRGLIWNSRCILRAFCLLLDRTNLNQRPRSRREPMKNSPA